MENLQLNLQSKNEIITYMADNHFMAYEKDIFNEMLKAIEKRDQQQLDWFRGFGDSFRAITMNVHAYRKGLEFGFTEIAFDQYGWFKRPEWLEIEELTFGDARRFLDYSTITLGRGANNKWAYGLSCSYGCGGCSWGISVYNKKFNSRNETLTFALAQLKEMMTEKIDHSDTTNYKQSIIAATLRDIAKAQVNLLQLSLF